MIKQAICILALVGVSSLAYAQSGTPEQQAACRGDVRRFCSKLPQGAGNQAYEQCLRTNQDKLSPQCLKALASHH